MKILLATKLHVPINPIQGIVITIVIDHRVFSFIKSDAIAIIIGTYILLEIIIGNKHIIAINPRIIGKSDGITVKSTCVVVHRIISLNQKDPVYIIIQTCIL